MGFDRAGEVLVDGHGFGALAVEHHAAVADCPTWPSGGLLAYESVFDLEAVLGVHTVEEQVSESLLELFVAVVADLDHPVLNAEGFGVIVSEFEASDFWGPASKVLAIEQGDPLAFLLVWGRGLSVPLLEGIQVDFGHVPHIAWYAKRDALLHPFERFGSVADRIVVQADVEVSIEAIVVGSVDQSAVLLRSCDDLIDRRFALDHLLDLHHRYAFIIAR